MIYEGDLAHLASLVDFLGESFGSSFEFVLHDFSKPEGTIIAIANGHITGRKVGDNLSSMTLKMINERIHSKQDFIKYRDTALFRSDIASCDLLICDRNSTPRGMFCINYPVKDLLKIRALIDHFTQRRKTSSKKSESESSSSFLELAMSMVNDIVSGSGLSVSDMTSDGKTAIVKKLQQAGVFQLKSIVSYVAEKLEVSEATVYRYLHNPSKKV